MHLVILKSPRLPFRSNTIPIKVDLDEIERKLQSGIPEVLADLNHGRQVCIPAEWVEWDYPCFRGWKIYRCTGKTKITPDIECEITGWVRRDGKLSVKGRENKIVLSLPVHARVSAKDVGGIVKSATAEARATVTAEAMVGIGEDWEPYLDIDLSLAWNQRPEMKLFNLITITCASLVEPYIARYMADIEQRVAREALADLNIRGVVEEVWRRLHEPLIVGDNPRISIVFTPRSVKVSSIDIVDNIVEVALSLGGEIGAYVGEDVPVPAITPLPRLSLSQTDDEDGILITIPIYLGRGGIGDPSVVRYLSGMQLDVDVARRLLIVEFPVIDDRLEVAVTYNFADEIESVEALLNKPVVVELGDWAMMVVDLYDVKVHGGVKVDEEGLIIEVEVEGKARIDVASGLAKGLSRNK